MACLVPFFNKKFGLLVQLEAKFPDKETKFLVSCATGRTHSISALIALDEAGYENLVGLKGGYNAWIAMWDNNFRRRGMSAWFLLTLYYNLGFVISTYIQFCAISKYCISVDTGHT